MKNTDFEDDGRVLADMSEVERRPILLPRLPARKSSGGGLSSLPREDRRAVIRGALGASLLIAGVFVVGLGIVIALLQFIWNLP